MRERFFQFRNGGDQCLESKLFPFFLIFCFVFVCLAGCDNKQTGKQTEEQAETEAFARKAFGDLSDGESSKSTPEKAKLPSDEELNEVVKKGLNRGPLAKMPVELVSVSVNWTDKSAGSALGKFSAKTKATEGLYKSIDNTNALKKLGITELFEGEVKVAEEKIWKLPEPHKTNLRNAMPTEHLERYRFFEVLVPQDGEVILTGNVELGKYGDDWQADSIQGNSISCGEDFIPSSRLQEAYKLDDPKTKEAVEAVVQGRKGFVAKVNSTITDLENARLAALKKQKDDFEKYCKPGLKYEGSFQLGSKNGAVRITFDEFATADKNSVKGTISYLEFTDIKWNFTIAVNTKEVSPYPVLGEVIPPRNDSIHYILKGDYKLTGREPSYETLTRMLDGNRKIAIRFTDKMIFTVSGYNVGFYENERITFDLTEK